MFSGFYKWLLFDRTLGENKQNECISPAGHLAFGILLF